MRGTTGTALRTGRWDLACACATGIFHGELEFARIHFDWFLVLPSKF
jgi:hypothetical protein